MTVSNLRRSAVSLSVITLLAACGGGAETNAVDARESAQQATTAPTETRTAVVTITPQMVFDFAQTSFKDLFPTASAPLAISGLAYEGKVFEVRGYNNGNFLGVSSNNEIWGLGPYTGNALTRIGAVSDYACQIAPSSCVVEPPPPTATLNECVDPATGSLPTGFRLNLVFTFLGVVGGDQTIDSVVDGPDTFEGQSAIRVTSTTTGTSTVDAGGITATTTTTTKNRTYEVKGSNGLIKTLGLLSDITGTTTLPPIGGVQIPPTTTTAATKTVFNPPAENIEFTLALGKSIDKTTTQTTTITAGPGSNVPQTITGTQRHTFEAKESITLANGKSYSTCRYKVGNVDGSNTSTTWFIVGKGVPARTQSVAGGKTQTMELKSGNYNGTPL
jgi:hypothetical protein